MPTPIRRFGPAICIAVLVLAMLGSPGAIHGAEPPPAPAPGQRPFLTTMAIIVPERLDHPTSMKKNGEFKDGVLELRGPIDAAMRQRFEEAVDTGTLTTVRITSEGGEIAHALRIGAVMEARDIDVIVHDLCTGACAQYIFIGARKRTLERQSLVGFMFTAKASTRLLETATETLEVGNPPAAATGRLVEQEEELYRKRGVSAALLLDPLVALQPRCMILKRGDRGISWRTTMTYLLWVPSRNYLTAAGVEFEGDWPKSDFWLGGLAFDHLKARAAQLVRYADEDPLRKKKQAPYTLEQLSKCVLDEEPDAAPQP